mmetsp:Transcript_10427/g.19475  ORF Transcript_10427/g.19475 Transcript_10427/m.19475 type:complete len:488 (-) Transcript_10427:1484-2947(-)
MSVTGDTQWMIILGDADSPHSLSSVLCSKDLEDETGQIALQMVSLQTVGTKTNLICKDQIMVAYVSMDTRYVLAIVAPNAVEVSRVFKRAAEEARGMLFAINGPNIAEWCSQYRLVESTIRPLLYRSYDCFFQKSGCIDVPDMLRWNNLFARFYPEEHLFESTNLDTTDEYALDSVEEMMDLLEEISQIGNDTLDEADLCLPVGIALVVNGNVVHSSFCKYDLADVYRLLLVMDIPQEGNVDESGLFCKIITMFSCVNRENGARVSTNEFHSSAQHVYTLEQRVLAVLALSRDLILVKVMLSQHSSPEGSGHIDPYGLVRGERALREIHSQGVLDGFKANCLGRVEKINEMLGLTRKTLVPEVQDAPNRPRSNSEGLWSRLRRTGSFRRRNRSSSLDFDAGQDQTPETNQVGSSEKLEMISDVCTSNYVRDTLTQAIGYLYIPEAAEQSLVETDINQSAVSHIETELKTQTGCSLTDVLAQFGIESV